MNQESRPGEIILTDRIIAVVAGLLTFLPYAFLAGMSVATLCVRAGTRERLTGSGLLLPEVAVCLLIMSTGLATLGLTSCRKCFLGRRSGFVWTGVLAALCPLTLIVFGPVEYAYIWITPGLALFTEVLVAVVAIVVLYACLRLTRLGPAPT